MALGHKERSRPPTDLDPTSTSVDRHRGVDRYVRSAYLLEEDTCVCWFVIDCEEEIQDSCYDVGVRYATRIDYSTFSLG